MGSKDAARILGGARRQRRRKGGHKLNCHRAAKWPSRQRFQPSKLFFYGGRIYRPLNCFYDFGKFTKLVLALFSINNRKRAAFYGSDHYTGILEML
jgi:hypothetical protein